MSISTCSEEDTLERYGTARSSAFQEEYSRIEGSGPGIEVSFGVEEHTQPPQDTIKAESSPQRSQCIAEGQKPDTLPDTRGRQQNGEHFPPFWNPLHSMPFRLFWATSKD